MSVKGECGSTTVANGAAQAQGDLKQFVEDVLQRCEGGPIEVADVLERAQRDLEVYCRDPGYDDARGFLCALKQYFDALVLLQTRADYASAIVLLDDAHEHLKERDAELAEICLALRLCCQAPLELARQNVGAGVALMSDAEARLAAIRGGPLAKPARALVDQVACDHLAMAGMYEAMKQDFSRAKALLRDAARKAEYVAVTYCGADSPDRAYCLGLAKLYPAILDAIRLWTDLGRLEFDRIDSAAEAGRSALEAKELFSRSGLENPTREKLHRCAGAVAGILSVLVPVARILHALLEGKRLPAVDEPERAELRKSAERAVEDAASLGEQGVVLVRVCEALPPMLDRLWRYADARPQSQRPVVPAPPVRLFAMLPYDEESAVIEKALLAVLEEEPYWFEVILARDRTLRPNLLENVKAHMELVDGFIADVSDLNPNIMLELGMAENDARGRPVVVLRRQGSKEPPSDLKGRLYAEYSVPGASTRERTEQLATQLRQLFQGLDPIEKLRHERKARHLSRAHVERALATARLIMNDTEVKTLQREFPSIETLQGASEAQIVAKTGFAPELAGSVLRALRRQG